MEEECAPLKSDKNIIILMRNWNIQKKRKKNQMNQKNTSRNQKNMMTSISSFTMILMVIHIFTGVWTAMMLRFLVEWILNDIFMHVLGGPKRNRKLMIILQDWPMDKKKMKMITWDMKVEIKLRMMLVMIVMYFEKWIQLNISIIVVVNPNAA